ncbi:hypothetical protein V6N11_034425 [Hibiscus sabdariffa]|uniref:Uncharacterized protein n=1 Tax=Hibiscus sabdariffa TaxID=183260 RepID=A0ABR2NMJ5_9ROSI
MNAVHVRDQKHELTLPRNSFPPKDIVYDQDIQLFGLKDKPITQQEALSRSESQPRYLPGQDSVNPQGPIFDFDPEIERTQRNLKRRLRRLMEVNRNNGQQPADGENLPAQAGGAIAPPIPQDN